jgi:hypothetical protein
MAAISARLANMGFMKRGQAVKPDPHPHVKQELQQPAAPSLRQQQQQRPAVKQEAAADLDQQPDRQAATAAAAAACLSADSKKPQQEGKYKLSENITNMKFMQRAQLKRSREDAFDQEQAAKDAAEWVAPTAVQAKGCLILHERDPLPAGATGRMSFGFGHMHDLAQAEEAEKQAAADAAAAGTSINDEQMGKYGMQTGWAMRTKDMAKHQAKRQRRQH